MTGLAKCLEVPVSKVQKARNRCNFFCVNEKIIKPLAISETVETLTIIITPCHTTLNLVLFVISTI
jgi:hypothetical protein